MTETTRQDTSPLLSSGASSRSRSPNGRLGRRLRPHFAVRPLALALAASSLLSFPPGMSPARAQTVAGLPSGMTVVNGQVKAATTGKQLTITNSSGSILNWQNFSIGAGNGVTFVQPNAQSQVLNRVVGNDPSSILGSLSSNGRVWLLNPNGVIFGQGARVDVGGLVTSTLNLNDIDWLGGRYHFTASGTSAGIVNQGELRSSLGGHIALIGGSVRNDGLIEAKGGQIFLAAGKSVEMIDTGSPNMRLLVTAPEGEALNLGTLAAAGGRIDVHAAVVNQQGVVRADSLETGPTGNIVLKATKALNLAAGSVTSASGGVGAAGGSISLDSGVEGTTLIHGDIFSTGTTGGRVEVLGQNVGLLGASSIDASGTAGGGQVLVGGGERGEDRSVRNSDAVCMASTASLKADAIESGDGGRLILWGNNATRAYGSFSARGGIRGGNGGFIETSGGWIDVQAVGIDASSPLGLAGSWLLDPYNISISDSAGNFGTTSGPTFTSTQENASISTSSIISALNAGNNVTIATGGGGAGSGTISLNNANINANPTANVSLSLDAHGSIFMSGGVIRAQGSGALDVSLNAGTGIFTYSGALINTNGGQFLARGTSTTSYGVHLNSTTIDTRGGSISIVGTNASGAELTAGILSHGVLLAGSTITGGLISISGGDSRVADQANSAGVRTFGSTTISASGAVSIVGNGTGSGILLDGLQVSATSGIMLSGAGGANDSVNIGAGSALRSNGQTSILGDKIVISTTGRVTSLSTGEAIVVNGAGARPTSVDIPADGLATPNGYWSVFASSRDGIRGGLTPDFLQYSASVRLGTGSGFFYSVSPTVTFSNNTPITKVYDGTTSMSGGFSIRSAGFLSQDNVNMWSLGIAYPDPNVGVNKPLRLGPLTVTGTFNARTIPIYGYNLASTVVGDITPAPLRVVTGNVVGNPTKAYDGTTTATLTPANYSLTGFVVGESASVIKTSGTYDNANAGARTVTVNLVGSDYVAGAGTSLSNYALPTVVSGPGTIDTKLLTLEFYRPDNQVYNGFRGTNTSRIGSLLGLVGSETVSIGGFSQVFDTADVGVGKLSTFTVLGLRDGTGLASNYRVLPATGRADITPAPLTLTANNAGKTYGTALAFTGSEFTSSGLVAGETIGSVTLTSAGAAPTASVEGGPYPIVPSNARGGTFAATNYNITYAPGALTVNPAELRVVVGSVIGNPTKTYDGTATATLTPANYSLTGFASGESASVTKTSGTYDSSNAGNRTVTVTLNGSDFVAGSGTNLSNYSLPRAATGPGTIDTKLLTLVNIVNNDKVYDGTVRATGRYDVNGFIGTDSLTVGASGDFDTKDAGFGKTVSLYNIFIAAGSGTGLASNYRIAPTATTTGNILPKELIALNVTAANKIYDGTTVASVSVGTYEGLVLNETLGTSGLVGAFDTKDVGNQKPVTITGIGLVDGANGGLASNYRIAPSSTTTTADITPAALTITANDQTKPYNSEFVFKGTEFTAAGLVSSENISSVTLTSTGAAASARVEGSPYPIVPTNAIGAGGFLASNYAIRYLNGSLTVSPLQLQVFANLTGNPSKVYDGDTTATLKETDFSLSGFVNNDGAAITKTTGTYDSADAGSRTVTVNLLRSDFSAKGDTSLGNYLLPSLVTGAGTINQKPVTLTQVIANSRAYDGTRGATLSGTPFFSGLVGNETLSLRAYLAQFDTKDAGTGKTVTLSGVELGNGSGLASNYILAANLATGTADIFAKAVTIAGATAGNKVYDGNTAAVVTLGELNGMVAGESLNRSATGNFVTKDVGVGKEVVVTASLSDGTAGNGGLASNYRLTQANLTTTANVDPALVTAAAVTAADRAYDGTRSAMVTLGPLNGLVGNETLGSGATGSFDSKDVGNAKRVDVSASLQNGTNGGLASNYRIAPASTTASITPKELTLASVSANDKTYDASRAATFTTGGVVGLVAGESLGTASSTATFDTKDVGTGKTVTVSTTLVNGSGPSGALASNYRIAPATTTAAITPATLTYTADPAAKIVGAPLPPLNGAVSGFVEGETLATASTGSLGFTTRAKTASPAGSYAVDGGGLVATNYRFVQAPGNATALTVTGLPPQVTEDPTKVALSTSLTSVTLPVTASSPAEGRVADVITSLRPDASSTGSSFQRVSISTMSQDELIAMLNSRDRYKKNIFEVSIKKLEQDPRLADTAECATAADAEAGSCVITEKVKNQIREQRAAILAAAEAVSAPPTIAAPATIAPPARVAPPSPVAVAKAAATRISKAREQAAIRRKTLEAALPQIERKFAVVIGVNEYEDDAIPGLDNSVGDSRAVGLVLEGALGYETLYLENASKKRVIAALNKLAVDVGPKDSVVIYYAGHGELIESTKLGYWQLSDSDSKDPTTWLSNSDITKLIGQIGASQIALISDSCYSGSLVDERIRSGSTVNPSNILGVKSVVVMSSGGNEPVFDAGKEGHSPFAFSLMNNLKQVAKWQAGGNVFERIRFQVARELPQRPQYGSNSVAGHQAGGDYLFEQRTSTATNE